MTYLYMTIYGDVEDYSDTKFLSYLLFKVIRKDAQRESNYKNKDKTHKLNSTVYSFFAK